MCFFLLNQDLWYILAPFPQVVVATETLSLKYNNYMKFS